MKRRLIGAAVLTLILMLIGVTALAAEATLTQDGVFARVTYTCRNDDGSWHSPSVSITKIEIVSAAVNEVAIKVYFKGTCTQNSEHGLDRTSWPLPMTLNRASCTETMDDLFYMNIGSGPDFESVYVYASMEGTPHVWENGKCKNCPAECDHVGNANPPTCTQPADCSICGKTLDALGHDVKTIDRVEPTCTLPGHTEGSFCDRCKEVFTESLPLNPLEHDVKTIDRVEPTCTLPGHTEGSFCGRCKEVFTESLPLNPLGHDVKIIERVEPTCTVPGLTAGKQCTVCRTILQAQQPIPAKGHDYRQELITPTCTTVGYTKHICTACGDAYTDQSTARRGHYYGRWLHNGASAHTASCLRQGCTHSTAVACKLFTYALPSAAQENDVPFTFCPVCGFRQNADAMTAPEGFQLSGGGLGELIVYETQLSAEERLFTVALEHAGVPVQPGAHMEILLPFVPAEDETLTLLQPDGSETPLSWAAEKNGTRVTLDYPAENETEDDLVRVLRLARTAPAAD